MIPDELTDRGYVDLQRACLPVVGEWAYSSGILGGTALAPTLQRWTAHPAWIAPGTYDALGVSVVTAVSGGAGVVGKVALYADDPTQGSHYIPNTAAELGRATVSLASANTIAAGVLASPFVCPGGFYWLGFHYFYTTAPSTAPTLACISNCTYSIGHSTQAFTNRLRGWARTGLSDLPTVATTPSTSGVGRSGSNDVPIVGLRRSA